MTPQERYFRQMEIDNMILERDELNKKIIDAEIALKMEGLKNEKSEINIISDGYGELSGTGRITV